MKIAVEVIKAYGHANISAIHNSTIEITKDDYLTPQGDCIIGVNANKAAGELSQQFKDIIRDENTIIVITFVTSNSFDYLIARGSKKLNPKNNRKIIIRRSDYIDESTIAIKSSKAAIDISRKLVEDLINGSQLYVILIAIQPRT